MTIWPFASSSRGAERMKFEVDLARTARSASRSCSRMRIRSRAPRPDDASVTATSHRADRQRYQDQRPHIIVFTRRRQARRDKIPADAVCNSI